jgi:hypothetical protein
MARRLGSLLTPSERIDTAAKTYLAAIGASAIYVCVERGQPISVGVARDLDKALRHLHSFFSPAAAMGWIAWGLDYGALVQLAQAVKPVVPLHDTVMAIANEASVRGMVLTPHGRALERAAVYADYLDQAIAAMQRDGTLGQFNRAYKFHRLERGRHGEAVQPYWAVMQELRAVIIRSLVAEPKNRMDISAVITEIRQAFPWFACPTLLPKRKKRKHQH